VIFQAHVHGDGSWEYTYLSQRADEFFGVPPSVVIGEKRQADWHPGDRERVEREMSASLSEGRGLNVTGRIRVPGAGVKWVNAKAEPVRLPGRRTLLNGLILDITQRKIAEQEHLASERKVKAMSQAVEDALVMMDSQGLVRFWNPAAERLFGYSAEEALGMDFHAMAVPGEFREKAREGVRRFAGTGRGNVVGSTIQTEALNRRGDVFPVEVSLAAFQVDQEWFAVGTVRDITERRRMEEEAGRLLEESRRRNAELELVNRVVRGVTGELDFDRLLDFTVSALEESFRPHTLYIALYDREAGEICFPYYRAGDRRHQVPPQTLGQGLTSKVVSTGTALLLGTLRAQKEQGAGIVTGECEAYLGVPIMAGRQVLGVLSLQDPEPDHYTEDHVRLAGTIATNLGIALENARLYQEIQAAEERSRMILESVGEGIFGLDSTGRMTFVNPAALRMLGFSEDDMIGEKVHALIHHSHTDGTPYDEAGCPMNASYSQGTAHQVADEVLWRKDGTGFPVEYASTPILKDGRVLGAVVTFRDVTERRMADERLKANLEELERFNRLAVDREEKMILLKSEINDLMKRLGIGEKYRIVD
jgi:PAS domain S-box-containing protein